jgi:hypothetical protein
MGIWCMSSGFSVEVESLRFHCGGDVLNLCPC